MDRELNYDLQLFANITWWYDQSPALGSLIEQKAQWYANNYEAYNEGWFKSVFNLKTANLFGCIVWSYILDVPTGLIYSAPVQRAPWGFGNGRENFQFANFYGAANVATLTLDEARRLLRVRYYAQTISPTVSNLNGMLKDVFGDLGTAYMSPGAGSAGVRSFGFGQFHQNFRAPSNFNASSFVNVAPMEQQYIFNLALSPNFKQALQTYLPRGAGVNSSILSQ